MKILIFGSNSSVGKELVPVLNNSMPHLCRDFNSKPFYQHEDLITLSSIECNLTDKHEVYDILKWYNPDCVINLAARVGGIFSNIKQPYDYLVDNISMNSNVIDMCRKLKINNLLSLSSTCAYPDVLDDSSYPITEDCIHLGAPPISNIGYGYAKRVMQLQTDLCNQQYGTNFSYLIPCNLYGPYSKFDEHSHFLSKLIRKIWEYNIGKVDESVMAGGSSARRQYLFTADLVDCIMTYVKNGFPLTKCNIAPIENRTIKEITNIALKACNCGGEVIFLDESMSGQVRRDVSSELYLKNNSLTFTSLEDGIKLTYEKVSKQWALN